LRVTTRMFEIFGKITSAALYTKAPKLTSSRPSDYSFVKEQSAFQAVEFSPLELIESGLISREGEANVIAGSTFVNRLSPNYFLAKARDHKTTKNPPKTHFLSPVEHADL
jgi:hypothetical protein